MILDFSDRHILAKSKALTTHDDLSRGIHATLTALPTSLLPQVRLVSLSTTLATNAIVENTGGKVGALLIGFDAYDLARIAHYPRRVVPGRIEITGRIVEPLDEDAVQAAISKLCEQEPVDAVAISGMVSAMNPALELRAKEIVQSLTDMPVVCAHELSMQLDSIKRTQTAILNARLLPVIAALLQHVRAVMDTVGVQSPLMVVRGDGSLMPEELARQCPVETILSGPAASLCGAQYLCDADDGLVIDIGGTTSDIALLDDRQPRLARNGVTIGQWSTDVRAVEIETVGLGGDSAITLSPRGQFSIGPRRAIPLAYLAHESPQVLEEMRRLWEQRNTRSTLIQPVEFFRRVITRMPHGLTPTEQATLDALQDGPLSRDQLAGVVHVSDPSLVPVVAMESHGYLQRSTLTPTDILHYEGAFTSWDRTASELGLILFAYYAGGTEDALSEQLYRQFANELARHLLHRLLSTHYPSLSGGENTPERILLELLIGENTIDRLDMRAQCQRPLIAIGAPAEALACLPAHKLAAQLIIPEHADVANAIGAITGALTLSVEATITLDDDSYLVHSPHTRCAFTSLEEAENWAGKHVRLLLHERIATYKVEGITFSHDIHVTQRTGQMREGVLFLDGRVRGIAVGRPASTLA
ncbi:MAG: Acetophenone carboxylase gamma subunit [bacterium ADurb.Bin429]|nr:MAG: Acetophenone carboxylase gamma subunit [bacterium ADurb.Bin429]